MRVSPPTFVKRLVEPDRLIEPRALEGVALDQLFPQDLIDPLEYRDQPF